MHTRCGRCATCNLRTNTESTQTQQPKPCPSSAKTILTSATRQFLPNPHPFCPATSVIQSGPTHQPHILLDRRLNHLEILFNARQHTTQTEREMQSNEGREKGRRCESTAPCLNTNQTDCMCQPKKHPCQTQASKQDRRLEVVDCARSASTQDTRTHTCHTHVGMCASQQCL